MRKLAAITAVSVMFVAGVAFGGTGRDCWSVKGHVFAIDRETLDLATSTHARRPSLKPAPTGGCRTLPSGPGHLTRMGKRTV